MEQANAEAQIKEADSQLHEARNDAEGRAPRNRLRRARTRRALSVGGHEPHQPGDQGPRDRERCRQGRRRAREVLRGVPHVPQAKYLRYTQENMYWHEAEFESAKSQLAKQNNIAPKGVAFDAYPKQLDERKARDPVGKDQGRERQGVGDRAARCLDPDRRPRPTRRTVTPACTGIRWLRRRHPPPRRLPRPSLQRPRPRPPRHRPRPPRQWRPPRPPRPLRPPRSSKPVWCSRPRQSRSRPRRRGSSSSMTSA